MSHLLRSLLAAAVVEWLGPDRRTLAGLVVLGLWLPGLALVCGFVGLLVRMRRRLVRRRQAAVAAHAELGTLGDLLTVALTAGMSLQQAMGFAAAALSSDLRAETESVVRAMSRHGSAAVMAASGGVGGRLYLLLGRALATGAPVVAAVETFVDEIHGEKRARREAAARRLPVLLVFPLALLILPGFVLLVVAPAFLGALDRVAL